MRPEVFAPRFHYFEDPFHKFFALNLLFQDTSCRYSLALKYLSFLVKFFSFAFYDINFWFKISKICPKILHFSKISHSRGTLVPWMVYFKTDRNSLKHNIVRKSHCKRAFTLIQCVSGLHNDVLYRGIPTHALKRVIHRSMLYGNIRYQ